jgi:hypothetical protein
MFKVKVDSSPFLFGIGIYVSKKTWNLTNDGTWFGPSIVIHIANRMIRFYWKMQQEESNV